MKTVRHPRKTAHLTYAACEKDAHFTCMAIIKNISASGALISTTDDFEIGANIIACPVEDTNRGLPTPEQVYQHPNHIEGVVVRKDGFDLYAIHFGKEVKEPESYGRRDYGLFTIERRGLLSICILSGNPDLKKFVQFCDHIKQKALLSLRLILDFSHTAKAPQTGAALMKDVLEYLLKERREIAAVNCEAVCPKSIGQLSHYHTMHHFSSREEAEADFERRPYTILIVEDDEVTLQFTSKYLEKQNFRPLEATTAEEGVKLATREKPDLILMDINLPGMNGIEAVEHLRAKTQTKTIPIIMLTGESSRKSVESCLQHNVNEYILKPFDPDNLFQKIIDCLIQTKKANS
jgi:CheY-like chemotaxis protein